MWMGVCVLVNLGASSGQINVIPVDYNLVAEVSIHRLGAISVGMVALSIFLICREHLFSIPALFLAQIAAMHGVGWASGWRGAIMLQNCPFAC